MRISVEKVAVPAVVYKNFPNFRNKLSFKHIEKNVLKKATIVLMDPSDFKQ